MDHLFISSDQALREYCRELAEQPWIAFDTEFVSEFTYYPELCLIQVASPNGLAVVDPLAVSDVTPFWEVLCQTGHETIVHAGREEFRFCRRAVDRRPTGWFDVQMAAGMTGLEFPAAYSTLLQRVLGKSLPKGETRTDWRRRPLSSQQLKYALQDVEYLHALRKALGAELQELEREAWLNEELLAWQNDLEEAESAERWRRVSGISGLNPRMLAIVRELWRWREGEAQRLNKPPRRVLRDDLIVELARRRTPDIKRIRALRGMERRNLTAHLEEISQAIRVALDLSEEELPRQRRRPPRPQLNLLAQFLSTAVNSLCIAARLAPAMVGTTQDVRDLIGHHLFPEEDEPDELPLLARGWRAQVVGRTVDQLLDGQLAIRIEDPLSDHPLTIEGC